MCVTLITMYPVDVSVSVLGLNSRLEYLRAS